MRRDLEKRLLNEKQQYTSLTSLSPVYMVFDNTIPITLTSIVPSGGGRYYLGRGGGVEALSTSYS